MRLIPGYKREIVDCRLVTVAASGHGPGNHARDVVDYARAVIAATAATAITVAAGASSAVAASTIAAGIVAAVAASAARAVSATVGDGVGTGAAVRAGIYVAVLLARRDRDGESGGLGGLLARRRRQR